MTLLVEQYRRLDRVQRTRWFRIAASAAMLLACVAVFGVVLRGSHRLDRERAALADVLYDTANDMARNREAARTLRETGTIVADGIVFGGPQWKGRADLFVHPEAGVIAAQAALMRGLLLERVPTWVPAFLLEQPRTSWVLAIVITAWLQLIIWMGVTVAFLLTLLGTGAAVALCWRLGSERWMLSVAGIGVLTFTYVLCIRGLMLLLQFPLQPLAVAHTIVKESTRLRIALVFIVLLLVGLPLIPLVFIDDAAPLRFRIQSFISASMRWTFGLAAVMTLLLACASVAFEIRDRQIWQLVTKPMARLNYLLGKWIGIIGINLVIVLVAGVSIFLYTQYLRNQNVASGPEGQLDRLAVEEQILTARIGVKPAYETLSDEQVRTLVEDHITGDAELMKKHDEGTLSMNVWRGIAGEVIAEHRRKQRVIPPFDPRSDTSRTYVFSGLDHAGAMNAPLTLKYRFFIGQSSEHERYPVAFVFNDDPQQFYEEQYTPTVTDTRIIRPGLVQPDGTLTVSIINLPSPTAKVAQSMSFEEKDFEILFKADTFEMNFLRALLVTWIKLTFLAMLGLACATFLSFPVACLLSFTIYFAALIGPFMTASLFHYAPERLQGSDWTSLRWVFTWLFENTVYGISSASSTVLSTFGDVNPTQSLVEGRLISWAALGEACWRIGILWCGVTLIVGHLVFRKRELATYSGQG
jgi:ABC-type transport system involved in multi-copper enzyme maturation permease subunit